MLHIAYYDEGEVEFQMFWNWRESVGEKLRDRRGAVRVIWGEIEMWERFAGRQEGITDGNIATSQLSIDIYNL